MFSDDMTLGEARDLLRTLVKDGERCPCCSQFAKVYKRKVNSSMARGLIAMYRAFGNEFGYVQDIRRTRGATDNREEPKLRYWGLAEEENVLRPDGGRAGYWRVTPLGINWVLDRTTIPKYALIYDTRCLRLEGEVVTIVDALGTRFNYRDLMNGE
jgi:hypothetical protein